jgi:preprotein translocase SecE subunit
MPAGAFFRIRTSLLSHTMNIANYFKETKAELKEVSWPTLAQTITYTVTVILISLVVAAILGGADFGLKEGLVKLLAR